jgi:hypothetical protein
MGAGAAAWAFTLFRTKAMSALVNSHLVLPVIAIAPV